MINSEYKKLKLIQVALMKANPSFKGLFVEFFKEEIKYFSAKTIVNNCYKYANFFTNIDPFKKAEIYILKNIVDYKIVGWRFYNFLYKKNLLNKNYRFLNFNHDFKLVMRIIENDLSIKNIICIRVDNSIYKYIVSSNNKRINNFVELYFESIKVTETCPLFPDYITTYLNENNIYEIYNVNDSIIEECLLNCPSPQIARNCVKFFIFCCSHQPARNNFKLYNEFVLSKHNFISLFFKGYRPVIFNKYDKIPSFDKWILIPLLDTKRSTQITEEVNFSLDFTLVKNNQIKILIKEWLWNHSSCLVTNINNVKRLTKFANMFFNEEDKITEINQQVCASYKSYVLAKWKNKESRSTYIYCVSDFINYLDKYSNIKVDKSCYLFLNNHGSQTKGNPKSIKKEDLIQIASYINNHKNDDHNHLCLYVMFHIALNTEFRISQIATLKINCLKESIKRGEYVICSNTKQSQYEQIEQPCSKVVKEIIEMYLNATENYRNGLNPELRKYLFIREDLRKQLKKPFSRAIFYEYMKEVCSSLNLPKYNSKNLRITYITAAKEYALKNNINDLTLLRVTNHSSINTINNHYLHENITDALQATTGVIIGDVNIDGVIDSSSEGYNTTKQNSVANGCGYCQSKDCAFLGPYPCQKCKYFFTTLSNIPFYKKEIKRLQALNDGKNNPHDAEDIIKLIRMNTYILNELLILQKRINNGIIY